MAEFESINQATTQGNRNGTVTQVKGFTDIFALKLLLVEAQLAIEGIETALHTAARKIAALGDEVVGQTKGNINQSFVLDIG